MPDKTCGSRLKPTIADLEEILKSPDADDVVVNPDGSCRTERRGFREELTAVINRFSMESGCNTPDFILAKYLANCLHAFDEAVKAREKWYGPGEMTQRADPGPVNVVPDRP